MPNLEVHTQIIEAVHATDAEVIDGELVMKVVVQSANEPVLRIFHIAAPGQKKILDALTGGLVIPTVQTPKDI